MSLAWIVPAVLAPGAVMAARSLWRERRHLPAAADNLPPADTTDLWTCRRINALPTATRKEKP
ncbi:hypothetical protein [Streptomyces coeruleorubidus]|uniref:Uncharacterized protein n=1 Tax=Streptomyces coeruleorubidus TaxID=116188 RepID=A0A5J6HUS6_STRC4|nr:hypothetical protein [Streptomyces coeruleorubidus]QEV23996.1 hypothetical protein CP976_07440 [Streptomyces coeruleorubidus]GGT85500.1 hypothetical protein GCM10010256_52000 [Streptomyces coeruleorubidus]